MHIAYPIDNVIMMFCNWNPYPGMLEWDEFSAH